MSQSMPSSTLVKHQMPLAQPTQASKHKLSNLEDLTDTNLKRILIARTTQAP